MVESSDEPSLPDCICFKARKTNANLIPTRAEEKLPPVSLNQTRTGEGDDLSHRSTGTVADCNDVVPTGNLTGENMACKASSTTSPHGPPSSPETVRGEASATIEPQEKKLNIAIRFYTTFKEILLSSWMNVLLIFVPAGIAANFTGVNPTVIFALNAIAIIPLAGMLSHATEAVACRLGDTIGALLNVTFGNAVELIIFIALNSDQIRIVQASLLGSILANLLLILGMCFLFGGLRFREQLYNSTVTQMSACLLSLSVMSLLLPTAFHASFTSSDVADNAVLKVSRGTSVILLFVYVLYLLFQLKSHAYMYASTPQHVIDEESHPGLLADMLGNSSASDSSSSSSSSDSGGSSGSNTTAKRIRRALRGRRRRKSSVSSKDTTLMSSAIRTPSIGTSSYTFNNNDMQPGSLFPEGYQISPRQDASAVFSGDEADTDGEHEHPDASVQDSTVKSRDFENEKVALGSDTSKRKFKRKNLKKGHRRAHSEVEKHGERLAKVSEKTTLHPQVTNDLLHVRSSTPHVEFERNLPEADRSPKRPFNLRGVSVRGTMPKMLTSTVFSATNGTGPPYMAPLAPLSVPRAPYGLRRTSSLPEYINRTHTASPMQLQPHSSPPSAPPPAIIPIEESKAKKSMSRTSAIILLIVSTALVAVCAEFLVSSINYLVENTNVSEAFIGLIILPIVGNAAEHVTAVTVASKNKMDLAIGVAVGSSIQIALFVTPVIVLLGWILSKDMSLYFSLFETVSLFVSAFIVNFLVLDGRSNYLEGALLIAAYVIIAVAAFFYPDSSQQSPIGGAVAGSRF